MALNNDYDDLMGDIEWEESEVDSGYFNEDDQAGTPMDSWPLVTFYFSTVLITNTFTQNNKK